MSCTVRKKQAREKKLPTTQTNTNILQDKEQITNKTTVAKMGKSVTYNV